MGRRCLIATLALAGIAPPAQAAEVSTVERCEFSGKEDCITIVEARYVAFAGEKNDLSVAFERGTFTFRDVAPIAAGAGCTMRSDGAIACRAYDAHAELGEGANTARTTTPDRPLGIGQGAVRLDGGAGDDVPSGGGLIGGGRATTGSRARG